MMDIREAITWLRQHGAVVGAAAGRGDKKAIAVVQAYQLVESCSSDEMAQVALCGALEAWRRDGD